MIKMRAWTDELSIHTKVQLMMMAVAFTLVFYFIFLQPQSYSSNNPPTLLITSTGLRLTDPVTQQASSTSPIVTAYHGSKLQTIDNTVSPITGQIHASAVSTQSPGILPAGSEPTNLNLDVSTPIATIGASVTAPLLSQNSGCVHLLILAVCTN